MTSLVLSVWGGWPVYLAAVVLAVLVRGVLSLLKPGLAGRPRRLVEHLLTPFQGARGLLLLGPLVFLAPYVAVDYAAHARRQAAVDAQPGPPVPSSAIRPLDGGRPRFSR